MPQKHLFPRAVAVRSRGDAAEKTDPIDVRGEAGVP